MNKKDVKKDQRLTVRMTAKELENIKKLAKENGYKSVSKFIIDKTTN